MATTSNHLCVLGIDIGTSSVKLSVIEKSTRLLLHLCSKETNTNNAKISLADGTDEQDVSNIFSALHDCLVQINEWADRIDTIAVTGQMHGVVLWQHKENFWCAQSQKFQFNEISPLYTWQDARCSRKFLATLPPDPHSSISTGFGCATLFWLHENHPQFLSKFNRAGTIQDLLVVALCNLSFPLMSEQNAASWGYFDLINTTWNLEKLRSHDFPTHFLPKIKTSGSHAGKLTHDWFRIKSGAQVGVALGDFQCAFYALHERDTDAVLNISTSAQLAVLMPTNFIPGPPFPAVIWAPYFEGRFLAEAASLNGGNVLATFVTMLREWLGALDVQVPSEFDIWNKLLSTSEISTGDLNVSPTIFGERHLPEMCGSITNINPTNISLDNVFHALCTGLVSNLRRLMPDEVWEKANIDRIVATGSVVARNTIVREEIQRQFTKIPVVVREECDAATGAALVMIKS
uniref:Sedoheptulokinase n=1 Tax=Strigamia maritima TaxID=126957 RepID=T1J2S7_STRMM